MYLRTPKRYRRQRRSLRLFSARTVLTLLAIPAIGYVGWLIWRNQETIRSSVVPEIENVAEAVKTQMAPHPTATPTPNLAVAQTGCVSAYQQGQIDEAIEQCRVLTSGYPNDEELHYRVTHMLVITSNFGNDKARLEEALVFAEKTINANPESPYGWAIRAMVYDWMGDLGRALSSALHARSLDERFAPTYAFLGEIYHDLGQNDMALGYLDQALELDTSGIAVAYTFRTKGKVFSDQGFWEDAIQPYQAALQNAPNHAYIAIELANNYIALGEVDRAIQLLSSTFERNPTDPAVLFKLATAHQRNGSYDRAFEYYRRCLDVDRNNVLCLSYLGGLQYFDGDYATAINNLERAIELGSSDPDDFLQVGQALTALGRCNEATLYLQQGYQLVVDLDDAERQAKFVNALQSCDVLITQSSTGANGQ